MIRVKMTSIAVKGCTVFSLIIFASALNLDFISDCSPFRDRSCTIRCHICQCAQPSCGLHVSDNSDCGQNVHIHDPSSTKNFVQLSNTGVIAASLKLEVPQRHLPNLTTLFLEVHSVSTSDSEHFVAVFSQMEDSDIQIFNNEVVLEFPVKGIKAGEDIRLSYSTNICSSSEVEVLKVPEHLPPSELMIEYPDCPEVKLSSSGSLLGASSTPAHIAESNATIVAKNHTSESPHLERDQPQSRSPKEEIWPAASRIIFVCVAAVVLAGSVLVAARARWISRCSRHDVNSDSSGLE